MRKNIKTETREGNCQSTSPSHKRRQNLIHYILLPDQFIYNNKKMSGDERYRKAIDICGTYFGDEYVLFYYSILY